MNKDVGMKVSQYQDLNYGDVFNHPSRNCARLHVRGFIFGFFNGHVLFYFIFSLDIFSRFVHFFLSKKIINFI